MKVPTLRIEPPMGGLGQTGLSLVDELAQTTRSIIERHRGHLSYRLPPVRQMASRWGVSIDTVVRAYEQLAATGWIEARHGSGHYVKQSRNHTAPPSSDVSNSKEDDVQRLDFMSRQLSIVKPAFAAKSRSGVGSLPAAWLQQERIAAKLRELGRREADWSDYPDPQGYLPLRQFVSGHLLQRGIEAKSEQILLTAGASEALQLIVSVLVRRSDGPVIFEDPCSPMLPDMLLSMGMTCESVPRDADGPDLDAIEALILGENGQPPARSLILNSVLHNPTGSCISAVKARRLARLIKRHQVLLIEDDSYGDLADTGCARLSEILGVTQCLYVGSFSKTLSPALRCGYVAGSHEHIKWLSIYRMVRSLGGSLLTERVIFMLLRDGGYRRHCERLQKLLQQSREPAASLLRDAGLTVPEVGAGMYIWAQLPLWVDAVALASSMEDLGHVLAPGRLFSPMPEHKRNIRFNIAETCNQSLLARDLSRQIQMMRQ